MQSAIGAIVSKSHPKPDAYAVWRRYALNGLIPAEVGRFMHSSGKNIITLVGLRVLWASLLSQGVTHPHGNGMVYVFIMIVRARLVVRVRRCSHLEKRIT